MLKRMSCIMSETCKDSNTTCSLGRSEAEQQYSIACLLLIYTRSRIVEHLAEKGAA